ncbi:MAG: TetR/AcrR family transcriptional regulator [Chloroflexota bacterium]
MPAGRHRSFDKDVALEKTIRIYWKNGYANTSLEDITQAIGITKPSLYAAFGNKEQLFIAAVEQYAQQYLRPNFEHLTDPTQPLHQRLRNCLRSIARLFSPPNSSGGCLLAHSLCEFTADGMPEKAAQFLAELDQQQKQMLVHFFAEEKAQGNLRSESPPEVVALFFMSINGGIAALARCGTNLDELDKMIEHAVQTFQR